jgi:hypothetical protein
MARKLGPAGMFTMLLMTRAKTSRLTAATANAGAANACILNFTARSDPKSQFRIRK